MVVFEPGIRRIHSLRTQLCLGVVVLLTLSVGSIGYCLMSQQRFSLRREMEKSLVLQGRSIAAASEGVLAAHDTGIGSAALAETARVENRDIRAVVITDIGGIIRAHSGRPPFPKPSGTGIDGFDTITADVVRTGETLCRSDDALVFRTPVRDRNKIIGHVILSYSTDAVTSSFHRALIITLLCVTASACIGVLLSLVFFKRISEPMGVLMKGIEEIGEGRYSARIDCAGSNEFHLLAESFNDMSNKIATAQDRLASEQRMDHELEIAREIQAALIPTAVPEPAGYQVAVHYKSASQVGGDYLDVIPIDPNNIAIVMADVSGKGVPGLVVMAMLKIMVTTLVTRRTLPVSLIRQLNTSMRKNLKPNMFVTFFIAYLNARTGRLVYSNAGHNPLVIFDPARKRCEFHKMAGPPLGIFPPTEFDLEIEEYEIQMEPGTLILQYTDGLNESMNKNGEQFSLNRILSECKRNAVSGAKTLVPCLIDAEGKFRGDSPPADDVAILALSAGERVPARSYPGD